MNDELHKFHELLGVRPGASAQELKEAYRDLAKVWHPDRFSHDPRLQGKAQEKLKEINEAYERLTSGRAARQPRPAPAPNSAPAPAVTTAATVAPREPKRSWVLLPTALVFCAVFVAALVLFVRPDGRQRPAQTPPAEREQTQPSDKEAQPENKSRAATAQPARGKEQASRQTTAEATTGAVPPPESNTRQLRPMPTVTVNVDAMTGLLATRDCPNVSALTFPAGDQPRQYCTVQHKTKIVPRDEPASTKGSRLKAIGKSLAAPFK